MVLVVLNIKKCFNCEWFLNVTISYTPFQNLAFVLSLVFSKSMKSGSQKTENSELAVKNTARNSKNHYEF